MNALSRKVSKSALVLALVAAGLLVGEAANAKAKFFINLCFVSPGVTPTMGGATSSKIENSLGSSAFNSANGVWCSGNSRMVNLGATNNGSGVYSTMPIGGAENMKITITSPTMVYQWAGAGNKTNAVSGKCTITTFVKMVVGSYDPANNPAASSYRQFAPAVGGTGNVPGLGLIKVKVDWKPQLGTQPTCSLDTSGL